MATRVTKSPLLRNVTRRAYAAESAPMPIIALCQEVKTTTLPNQLTVASLENCSPVSRVSVLFRAGSRYETSDTIGATHVLRIAAGLGTQDSTQFGITRNIQQIGGNLSSTTGREHIAYTLESTRNTIETGMKFLADVSCKQVFKPWELNDNIPRLKVELASLDPQVQVLDVLHKAAYRTGLGNSLFCPTYLVGKHNTETLQHHVRQLFTTNRTAVVGVGVDHEELVSYAQSLCLESGAGPEAAGSYSGGEIRIDTGSPFAYVAVAAEGASLKDQKEAVAFSVLQHALGTGPYTKRGSAAGSLLAKTVSEATEEPFAITALNASYTDSGLFGFTAAAPASDICKVIAAAVKQLKAGSVSAEDVTRGKNQVKVAVLESLESSAELLENLGEEILLLNTATTADQLVKAIDSVTLEEVNAAAKKVAGGQLSLAAIGNLDNVPYLDQL